MWDIPQSLNTSPSQNESVLQQTGRLFRELFTGLWNLTKFKQTLLLLITGACGFLLGIRDWALGALVAISLAITGIAVWCAVSPREQHDFILFKAASLYMLFAFVLIAAGAFLACVGRGVASVCG